MVETIEHKREKLKRLERAFVGAVSSALNYDSKEWVFNDQGRLHAVSSHFLNGGNDHDNGSIALALAKYQSSHFEPVPLNIFPNNILKTSSGEDIYYEYNSKTGSFLVPSKKQIKERSGDVEQNNALANSVENTHFNASLFVSTKTSDFKDIKTLHLVFRGTEQDLDSVATKYSIDAYTDLDKYYRQMEVFEEAIFKHIEENPNIKEFTVTGHSLGGAMAQFFHEKHKDFFEAKGINFYATTFGSPGADMKPWFSNLKDKFRNLRTSISWILNNRSALSDIREENARHNFLESQQEFLNPNNSLLTRSKAFFSTAINITSLATAYISSAINNKIYEVFKYNRVNDENIFKNTDTLENKENYLQEHYFHKYDPIPMLGGLAYNRSGDSYLLNNHIRQQKGANKFFKKIMGEHTSDAYIHNIVNEIHKVYSSTPELKREMSLLNPAFRSYIDGYNTINANKATYVELSKTHPELKDDLIENMFSGSKKNKSRRMANCIAEYKKAENETLSIILNISNNISSYDRNIQPVFTSSKSLINGKEVDLTRDYSDGILPIPSGHLISPISQAINYKDKPTFIIDHKSVLSQPIVNKYFNIEYDKPIATLPDISWKKSVNIIPSVQVSTNLNQFLINGVNCVAPYCVEPVISQVEKIKTYSASGKLETFLFENKTKCDLQPDLNLPTYNIHAVQSFHKDYTGDKLSLGSFIVSKLGLGKKSPNVDKVITEAHEIASFGATEKQIEEFGKDLEKFLKKPEVLANIKKIVSEREQTQLAELQERNTLHVKI